VQAYQAEISPEIFNEFWQTIEALDIAELTSSSPKIEREIYGGTPRRIVDAPTHTYAFYDGRLQLSNSFEVYAATRLRDPRYQTLHQTLTQLLVAVFGEDVL
ncbi:MAG: hypothetical protein AAFZ80_05060, partial [Cyanobacteria bacterium P01_A01_bin.105]